MSSLEGLPPLQPLESFQSSNHTEELSQNKTIKTNKKRNSKKTKNSVSPVDDVEPIIVSVPFKVETVQYPEIRAHLVCECIAQALFLHQQIPMVWDRLSEWAESEIAKIEEIRSSGQRVKPPKQLLKQLFKVKSTMDDLFSAIHDVFGEDSDIFDGSDDIVAVSLVFGPSIRMPLWTMVLKFCTGACSFDAELTSTSLKDKSSRIFRKKIVEESLRSQNMDAKRIKPTNLHVLLCCTKPTLIEDAILDATTGAELSERPITSQQHLACELPLSRVPAAVLQAVGEIDLRAMDASVTGHKKSKGKMLKRTAAAWPPSAWIVQIGKLHSQSPTVSNSGDVKRSRRSGSSPQWNKVRERQCSDSDSEEAGSEEVESQFSGGLKPLAPLSFISQSEQSSPHFSPQAKYRWVYFHKLVVKGLALS